jgi:RimJ/RimL family protein N-acetyltransferase
VANLPFDRLLTPRLTLLPTTAEMLRAEMEDRPRLVGLLGAVVPENWPPEILKEALPDLLRKLEDGEGMLSWYWLLHSEPGLPTVVGSGGLLGDPRLLDATEIGYSVLPQYQNAGFATEAVAAIVRWSFQSKCLTRILAHTFPDLRGSIRVLEKNGFEFSGEGEEPGTIRYVLLRERYEASGSTPIA